MSIVIEPATTSPPADPLVATPAENLSILPAKTRRERFRKGLLNRAKEGTSSLEPPRLKAFVLGLRDSFRGRDWDAHVKHWQDTDQMCRYYNGDHYFGEDQQGGTAPSRQEFDFAYAVPVMNGHVEQALMMLLRIRIEYEATPNDENDPRDKDLTKMCEKLGTREVKRLMDEEARYTEILNSIMAGESYRCLIWGIDETPRMIKRSVYETKTVETPGYRECQACKQKVPDGVTSCPNPVAVDDDSTAICGATFILDKPGGSFQVQEFKGNRQIALPRNILHIPHLTGIQRDLSASSLKYSTFIIERDYLPSKRIAEWRYQTDIDAREGGMTEGSRIRHEQERRSVQTDAIVGSAHGMAPVGMGRPFDGGANASSVAPGKPIEREQLWLEPGEYAHFVTSVAETLPEPIKLNPDDTDEIEEIPAGVILGDFFPYGVTICVLGNTIVKFKPVAKNRQWSMVLHGKRPGTSRGTGHQTGIPLQDIINDTFNLDYSILQSSKPLRAVVRDAIQTVPGGQDNSFLFINKLQPSQSPENVIAQWPAQSASGNVGATAQRIEQALQFILGTYSVGGPIGAPDAAAMSTATGVAAAQETASGRMEPAATQRIHADKELHFQVLENIQAYSIPEQREYLKKEFGPDTVERFFDPATCLRHVFTWGVVGNTAQPRSTALNQAKLSAWASLAGALSNSKAPWTTAILSEYADQLGITMSIGEGREDKKEAEFRLDKLAKIEEAALAKDPRFLENEYEAAKAMYTLLEKFVGPLSIEGAGALAKASGGDEMDGIIPFVFMQDHDAFMATFKDWLFSDPAKMASNARKMVVADMWNGHFRAQAAAKLIQTKFEAQLQQEIAPPAPTEPPAPDPHELELTKGAVTSKLKQEDHQRQLELNDAQLKNKLIEDGHRAESQIAVEGAKAVVEQRNGDGA